MDRIEIISKLTPIIRVVFKDETIVVTEDMKVSNIENWDSLANFMMITTIENEFSIKFSLRELNALSTVKAIVDSIETKTS